MAEGAGGCALAPAVGGSRSAGGGTRSRSGGPGPRLARAALVTAGLTAAGAVLGLARDQLLARNFGAGSETDAFLVAWTVPEFASTLLIEDAMALVLVPAFSRALARRGEGAHPDPVRTLVRVTLPRTALAAATGAALLALAAPVLVPLLAPGLPRQELAVDCTRLTATCVLSFALAGYFSAALRAHSRFLAPAAIYVAYNIGIITAIVLLGPGWGVRAAAAGVAAGGLLMALVQGPSLVRRLRSGREAEAAPSRAEEGSRAETGFVLALVAPVVLFAVTRQSQVLVERFLAAPLPAGAISHLNYAQKIAQLPMVLSLMLCTVSFPVVARAIAAGDLAAARRRAERDLLFAGVVVLTGAATVVAAAPQIVEILFQRGAFSAQDTASTAAVMRVYALGLLGHALVSALGRVYFSGSRPLWFPAVAIALGVAANALLGAVWVGPWGASGIALANAAGITLTAVLLLLGVGRHGIPLSARAVAGGLARLAVAAGAATAAGGFAASWDGPAPVATLLTGAVVAAVFLAAAHLLRAPVVPDLLRRARRLLPTVRPVQRRPAHDRSHDDPSLDRDVPLGRRGQG
ncbi:murein biosynthesis integral membrane protein MurJ [Streptomyces sp. MUM 203J]|uniref:murein biosynthesis integral membrane protein MurJ n=1 Tax=Streptomyces sp. MUM 203J TaxID=2791990 RepID=UPI001F0360A5|nr:lipid II flippase MurJ [Streptomyces sp. MUM 203J]